jgi:2',3'-cyclic-nucleotide 2'-phosphodiesterase (5'-nucleotidase family)
MVVAALTPRGVVSLDRRAIPAGGGDAALATAVAAAEAEHLTDAEKAAIAEIRTARDLPDAILFAAEAVRDAAGADAAFLGHTTFGTGVEAGPLTRHAFDAFVRFDGDIMTAEVPGETLAAILPRTNQHRAATLDARTGDFVYASSLTLAPSRRYRIAANDWTARNQRTYLGVEGIDFAATGLRLKAVVAEALARGA